MYAGDIYSEKERLNNLVGKHFRDTETGVTYKVLKVYHNIYKDVCTMLIDTKGRTRELIEESKEYYTKFEEVK